MNSLEITPYQLSLCSLFVIMTILFSFIAKLKLEKSIIIATLRALFQLLLLGFVLKYIFEISNPILIFLVLVWMVFWATVTAKSRANAKNIKFFAPIFISLFLVTISTILISTIVILNVQPWYLPQYIIPLGGMVIGNSMNGVAIALDKFFKDIKYRKDELEALLCLGANYKEASELIFKDAIHAGLIPIINVLMSVGLVSLPGMMTGQLLAGADPMKAVKYQIMIMIMILFSTIFGVVLSLMWVRKKTFNGWGQENTL